MIRRRQLQKYCVGISIFKDQAFFLVGSRLQKSWQILEWGIHPVDKIGFILCEREAALKGTFSCYLVLPYRLMMIKRFQVGIKMHEIPHYLVTNSPLHFNCPSNLLQFDYERLPESKTIRVLASKREEVNRWKNYFTESRLNLKLITADVLALEPLLKEVILIKNKFTVAVFFLNHFELLRMVFQNDHVGYVNTCQIDSLEIDELKLLITHFLREYENKAQDEKTVAHVLLLGEALIKLTDWVKKDLKMEVYSHGFLPQFNLPQSHWFALGGFLSC